MQLVKVRNPRGAKHARSCTSRKSSLRSPAGHATVLPIEIAVAYVQEGVYDVVATAKCCGEDFLAVHTLLVRSEG